jgi:glycosyltransferase involved in cell wall biosynthesis
MTAVIGIVTKVFPKLSESFILEEVLGLERRGLTLHVIALNGTDSQLAHARAAHVRAPITTPPTRGLARVGHMLWVHLAQGFTRPRDYLRAFKFARQHRDAGWWRAFTRAIWLADVCRREGIATLHVHFASEPAAIAEIAHAYCHIPFSVSSHAKDIYCAAPKTLQRKLSAARFVATCTCANLTYLQQEIAPSVPLHRVYHGIDTALFCPGQGVIHLADVGAPPLILAVGRLRPKKGFATLIRAVHHLRQRDVPVRCAIIGYGPELELLQALIADLDLAQQIDILGPFTHEVLIDWYRRATLFCLPCEIQADGDRDGIPNVMLEAMAMALPVITTPVSGIPEVITHGDNGWLVPPQNPTELAQAITELLAAPARCAALGKQARRTVMSMFDSDRNLAALETLLVGDGPRAESISLLPRTGSDAR